MIDRDLWLAFDRSLLWHPYTQHGLNNNSLLVASAKGAYLTLENGEEILDAISSWWVNIHGHGHSAIVQAIKNQAEQLDHVLFAEFTHTPAVQLAQLLIESTQSRGMNLNRVFYSDNGSTAVEVALKIAFQYQQLHGKPERTRFIALRNSYHGDTFGSMAVGEPDGFHSIFKKLLPKVDFVTAGNIEELKHLISKTPNEYAAFIFEPMIQGAAGMKIYDPHYLHKAVSLCRSQGILTIADEVFTGFYRTGKFLASEHAKISPDLLCLSKGITGGVLPLAATLTTEFIFSAFLSDNLKTAFLHGHSYTANAIACAAAIASWNLLHSDECQARIKMISEVTAQEVNRLSKHPQVKHARFLGTIGALELHGNHHHFKTSYFENRFNGIKQKSIERGILLRPLGNVVYAIPPYCVSDIELKRIYSVIEEILNDL